MKPLSAPNDSMIISFMTLRKSLGFLGISLVPVLILGSFLLDHTREVQVSASAYYYTSMRNGLVGIVCAMSLFLLSYHGNERRDSIASKLAGFFALGIAFLPTSESNDKSDIVSTLHYVTSGIFFAILSYMSIFLFTRSKGIKTTEKKRRNKVYRCCGIVMALSVALIPLSSIPAVYDLVIKYKPTLLLEGLALTAFGFSWLTKGEFLFGDKEDEVAKPAKPIDVLIKAEAEVMA
jgi:hypothetical protein